MWLFVLYATFSVAGAIAIDAATSARMRRKAAERRSMEPLWTKRKRHAPLFLERNGRSSERPFWVFFDLVRYAFRSGFGGVAGACPTGVGTSVDGPEPGAMVILSPGLSSG
jgi:hypothetical protein